MTSTLSQREKQVLHLISHEHNSKEIASQLYISEHTVVSHRKNMMIKMDAKNTAGLVRRGFEMGVLHLNRSMAVVACLMLLVIQTKAYAQDNCELNIIEELQGESFSKNISYMVEFNGSIIYSRYSEAAGVELWRSSSAAASGVLIKDISAGSSSSNPLDFYVVNDVIFFWAYTEDYGYELWKSNGTAAGTTMVKDINPGIQDAINPYEVDYYSSFLGLYAGDLYFVACTEDEGCELWKTNGNANGTQMVKSFEPGPDSGLSLYDSELVVLANNNAIMRFELYSCFCSQLWTTDGTELGTYLLDDSGPINEGLIYNGEYYYSRGGGDIRGLYKTDGTTTGTELVKQISDNYRISPKNLSIIDGMLLFSGDGDLWASDGTTLGTDTISSSVEIYSNYSEIGGKLVFAGYDAEDDLQLWSTDGTSSGTILIKDLDVDTIYKYSLGRASIETSGIIFFQGYDEDNGSELWRTDGTAGGTLLVDDSTPGPTSTRSFIEYQSANGKIFFTSLDNTLRVSNGTSNGTFILDKVEGRDLTNPVDLMVIDDVLYFTAYLTGAGHQIIRTNGTQAGTYILTRAELRESGLELYDLVEGFGGYTYGFRDGDIYRITADTIEQWKTDILPQGRVYDVVKTTDRVFLTYQEAYNEYALYVLDSLGTVFHADHLLLVENDIREFGDEVMCSVEVDGVEQLVITDGTILGTIYLAELNVWQLSYAQELGGYLYFKAFGPGGEGGELWRSDGTSSGTSLVRDIIPGSDHGIESTLIASSQYVFFVVDTDAEGEELWRSDGTLLGTFMLKDVNPGTADGMSRSYGSMAVSGDLVYFVADDGLHGDELWVSDGSTAGTYMVKDLNQGVEGIYHSLDFLGTIGGQTYLKIIINGVGKLYRTDGTDAGTVLIQDSIDLDSRTIKKDDRIYFTYLEPVNNRHIAYVSNEADGITDILDVQTYYRYDYVFFYHLDDDIMATYTDASIGDQYYTLDCMGCLANSTVDGIISGTHDYEASNSILSAGYIQDPATVTFSAANFVELLEGFEIEMNCSLEVSLDGCQD